LVVMKKMFGNELLMVCVEGDFYVCACINHIIEMLPETELSDCFPAVCRASECNKAHTHTDDCDFCLILARLKAEKGDIDITRVTIIRVVRQGLQTAIDNAGKHNIAIRRRPHTSN